MVIKNKVNITTIWWWTGSFNVLSGLKNVEHYNLAAVVAMADNGGSTGDLRDEFGVLPPGDIRKAILALSHETEILRELFNYRFAKDSSLKGHTIGNLLLTALSDITGNFGDGIKEINKMFRVQGKVFPVSLDLTHMNAVLENGEVIQWETNIDIPVHDADLKIEKAYLEPEAHINVFAKNAIENSDLIIIWPGDLYTSIVPNLLVKGVSEAIKKSKAKVVYFCNIMTKRGETTGFEVPDFVATIEKYLGENVLDYVVVNDGYISDELVEKYKLEEGKKPVKVKDFDFFSKKNYTLIERDLTNESDFVRHNPEKLAGVIRDIEEGWIK